VSAPDAASGQGLAWKGDLLARQGHRAATLAWRSPARRTPWVLPAEWRMGGADAEAVGNQDSAAGAAAPRILGRAGATDEVRLVLERADFFLGAAVVFFWGFSVWRSK